MVAHVCNHRTRKAEAGGLLCVQGQPRIYSEFMASLNKQQDPVSQKIHKMILRCWRLNLGPSQ